MASPQIYSRQHRTLNQITNNKMETKEKITLDEFLRRASSHFLCKPLPEDFLALEEEEIDEFINTNKTCWFKNCEANDLYEIIEVLAIEMIYLHEHGEFEFEL